MKLKNVKVKDLKDNVQYLWILDGQTVILEGRFIKKRGFSPEQELFVSERRKNEQR